METGFAWLALGVNSPSHFFLAGDWMRGVRLFAGVASAFFTLGLPTRVSLGGDIAEHAMQAQN
jgi:hypothetical protein